MRVVKYLCLMLLLTAATACSRPPGPAPSEHGKFFYWKLTDISQLSYNADCSDNEKLRKQFNIDKFELQTLFLYKIAEDGSKAILQECSSLETNSCKEHPKKITFTVNGSSLSWSKANLTKSTSFYQCPLKVTRSWVLQDQGHKMNLVVSFSLQRPDFSPPECRKKEAKIREISPNKKGIHGCVVTQTVTGEFFEVK